MPHAPQFWALVIRSTQALLQLVRPPPHVHALFTQVAPPPHCTPHVPQLELSVCRFTQALPHSDWPLAQEILHAPLVHTCPFGHTVAQAPQCCGFEERSTHTPLHSVWPFGHTHLPLAHELP